MEEETRLLPPPPKKKPAYSQVTGIFLTCQYCGSSFVVSVFQYWIISDILFLAGIWGWSGHPFCRSWAKQAIQHTHYTLYRECLWSWEHGQPRRCAGQWRHHLCDADAYQGRKWGSCAYIRHGEWCTFWLYFNEVQPAISHTGVPDHHPFIPPQMNITWTRSQHIWKRDLVYWSQQGINW